MTLKIPSNLKQGLPFFFSVASGDVQGVNFVKKFGNNPSISSETETIWDGGGMYEYLQNGQILSVASESGNDSISGSGARTVEVQGLDNEFYELSQTVELDGQNPVELQESMSRVFRVRVLTAGSSAFNEGNINVGFGSFSSGVPSNLLASVQSEKNQTQMALYTVPSGKVAFLCDYYNNVGEGKTAQVESYARSQGGVFQLKRIVNGFENSFFFPNSFPFFFDEKTDIEIRANSSSAGASVSAGFDMMIVEKGKSWGF